MTVESTLPPPPTAPRPPSVPANPAPPPEWPIERLIKSVGKISGAAGRFLDRLAKFPGLRTFMKIESSVWTGILTLLLLALYIAFGSGFASVRAKMEMTDLQFFDWYPMRILVGALALNLTIVTLRRIPLTLFKLGSWTVHIGILTLIGGSVYYFSHKTEGAVRIYLHQTKHVVYDSTERALYVFPVSPAGAVDQDHPTMTPLPSLPFFYDTSLDIPLPDSTFTLPGLTGVSARLTRYYANADLQGVWVPDHAADADELHHSAPALPPGVAGPAAPASVASGHPAIDLSMTVTGVAGGRWLIGDSPAERVFDDPANPSPVPGTEFLYHPSPETYADITTPLQGPVGVTVRVPAKNVTRTYTVSPGQEIAVEGTPYTLKMGDQQTMPMRSAGYENASSNSLMVSVTRDDAGKKTSFDRMVLFRYPERSPDFITGPDGKPKRIQDRVDNNIQLSFLDAQRTQFWIVEHEDGSLELVTRAAGGRVSKSPLPVGDTGVTTQLGDVPLKIAVVDQTHHLHMELRPIVTPLNQRKGGITAMDSILSSAVEMDISRGDFHKERVFIPFSQFAQVLRHSWWPEFDDAPPRPGRDPAIVTIPGVGKIGLLLATTRRELPSDITLSDFRAEKYPGASNSFSDFISTLKITDRASGQARTEIARLNSPVADHGLYYFQAAWDGNENPDPTDRFSVLGIGNRPGIDVMIAGAILMILGIGYAFYVKPILLNVKKKQLAAWAAARKSTKGPTPPSNPLENPCST